MSTLFMVGLAALAVGVVVLLFDGVFDLPDHQWFTLPGLAGGVATFCFTAGTFVGVGVPPLIGYVAGGVVAVGMYTLLAWAIWKLRHQTTGPDTSANRMLGRKATVVTPIVPGGTGQVEVAVDGEKRRMSAVSDDSVDAGQQVEVTELVSLTCVRVTHLR